MIKEVVYILLILLGIPVALFLGKMCKEEVKKWKQRFLIMGCVCMILSIVLFFSSFSVKIPSALTLLFMGTVMLTLSRL